MRHTCVCEVRDVQVDRGRAGQILVDDRDGQRAIAGANRRERGHVVRIWRTIQHACIAEARLVAIVVAVYLHRLINWRTRCGRCPSGADVKAFSSEDAENIGLGCCTVEVIGLVAPVVFRNRKLVEDRTG